MSKIKSLDVVKAVGFCHHGNIPSACIQCQKENKTSEVVHKETKDGLPVISSEEFWRMYSTDIRAAGENTSVTFDFQGFVKEDRIGYKDGTGTFYRDAMATNGILKAEGHNGIHIGTDGVEVDNFDIVKGNLLKTPDDVDEYDIYIQIPSQLQKEKHCVVAYGTCVPEQEFDDTVINIENARKQEDYIVTRLGFEPKNDSLSREKVQFIHAQIVRFIEQGGDLHKIQNIIMDVQKELKQITAEDLNERKKIL